MENAGLDNVIAASVALSFMLAFDEAITDNLMSSQANFLVENVKPYDVDGHLDIEEDYDDRLAVEVYCKFSFIGVLRDVFGRKLMSLYLAVAATVYFVLRYYMGHCVRTHGMWVSRTVYMPKNMMFGVYDALFGHPAVEDDEP